MTFLKTVAAAVVGAALIGAFGYVLVVNQHDVKLEMLEREIAELGKKLDTRTRELELARAFIVQAHPDKDFRSLFIVLTSANLSSELNEAIIERMVSGGPDAVRHFIQEEERISISEHRWDKMMTETAEVEQLRPGA